MGKQRDLVAILGTREEKDGIGGPIRIPMEKEIISGAKEVDGLGDE